MKCVNCMPGVLSDVFEPLAVALVTTFEKMAFYSESGIFVYDDTNEMRVISIYLVFSPYLDSIHSYIRQLN